MDESRNVVSFDVLHGGVYSERIVTLRARSAPFYGLELATDDATGCVTVEQVQPGSVADATGVLQRGDVVLAIGGQGLTDEEAVHISAPSGRSAQARLEKCIDQSRGKDIYLRVRYGAQSTSESPA